MDTMAQNPMNTEVWAKESNLGWYNYIYIYRYIIHFVHCEDYDLFTLFVYVVVYDLCTVNRISSRILFLCYLCLCFAVPRNNKNNKVVSMMEYMIDPSD